MGDPKTKRRGFSLIEMLVVMAIIAILAGLIFPLATTMREKGNQSACISNLQSVGQALKLYRLDERAYPPALYGFLIEGDSAPTTFLYPHYARSRREFKCPDNPNRVDETGLAGPFDGVDSPVTAVPLERVPKQGGGYDVKPILDKQIAYYLFDSYDGGVLPPSRKIPSMVRTVKAGLPGYEIHYRRDWGFFGASDPDRELLNRNPEDGTFVTACTYHRKYNVLDLVPGTGSWDMVLFLDGHTEKIPSDQVGPQVSPRGS
jgi:prepilin-type N-terminal cleavage/methylation domain-containing protein